MDLLQPGSRALRRGRVSQHERIYHVTTATRGRRRLFADLAAGRCVVRALRAAESELTVHTLAFVVMPDHLHWLFVLRGALLPVVVGQLKGRAARDTGRVLGIAGPIWQHGYHDHALRTDESLVATGRYIIGNPVRAGLVQRIGDYPLWDCVWIDEDRLP